MAVVVFSSCTMQQLVHDTPKELYQEGVMSYFNRVDEVAATHLETLHSDFPTSKYASFALLRLGELNSESNVSDRLLEAEVYFQSYLERNTHSVFVPYVLNRQFALLFRKSERFSIFGGFQFVYDHLRDTSDFKKILISYSNFYILYPNSIYLENAAIYLRLAEDILAQHEVLVGDWYFKNEFYAAAVQRYRYVLSNFPNTDKKNDIIEKFIVSLDKAQFKNEVSFYKEFVPYHNKKNEK